MNSSRTNIAVREPFNQLVKLLAAHDPKAGNMRDVAELAIVKHTVPKLRKLGVPLPELPDDKNTKTPKRSLVKRAKDTAFAA